MISRHLVCDCLTKQPQKASFLIGMKMILFFRVQRNNHVTPAKTTIYLALWLVMIYVMKYLFYVMKLPYFFCIYLYMQKNYSWKSHSAYP